MKSRVFWYIMRYLIVTDMFFAKTLQHVLIKLRTYVDLKIEKMANLELMKEYLLGTD